MCGHKYDDPSSSISPTAGGTGRGGSSSFVPPTARRTGAGGLPSTSVAGTVGTGTPSWVTASPVTPTAAPSSGGSGASAPTSAPSSGIDVKLLVVGRLFFSFLIFLALISPVMLHGGLNLSGSGYENAFAVHMDGGITAACAILFAIAVGSLIYGVYYYIRGVYYCDNCKTLFFLIVDCVLVVTTLVVSSVACSAAADWYADAGAGMSFCVFVGAAGTLIFIVRVIVSDNLISAWSCVSAKKFNKISAIVTASATAALVVALSVTAIVGTCYTDPCNSASYAFAETRADVLRQFGEPDGVAYGGKEYTYYSTEYVNINKMVDELDEKMQENDYSQDKTAKFAEIRKGLYDKKTSSGYRIVTIEFDKDGGFDGKNDTVVSYKARAVGYKTGELTDIRIYTAVYVPATKSIVVSYLAEYESGCFIKDTVFADISDYDPSTGSIVVRDALGKFTIDPEELEDAYMIGDSAFLIDDTLYIFDDIDSNAIVSPSRVKKVKRIVVMDGVESITSIKALEVFEKAERISLPDSLTYINIGGLKNTEYYKNEDNWDKGIALYAGNMLVKVKENAILGYKVREGTVNVNAHAFMDANKLESVTLPDGLKNIGEYAFSECYSLKNLNIPSSVTGIGDGAFSGCNSLASITIPDGVTGIGDYAFSGCNSLASITIPDGVTSIGDYAFSGCKSLTSITIPDSVTSIGDYAFSGCNSLASITIPDGVTGIGDYAFNNCSSIDSITIPFSVSDIGENAFANNTYLILYCEANGKPAGWAYSWNSSENIVVWNCKYNDVSSDGNVYTEVNGIRYTIQDGSATVAVQPKDVGDSIELPSVIEYKGESYSVTKIAENAFKECLSLEYVTIPSSVVYIGARAFSNCKSLESVDFELTSRWWCFYIGTSSSVTNLPSYNVAQHDVAAQYLKSTYANYDWKYL